MSSFFESSDSWLIHEVASPAIRLFREGYDVWLGNTRDNKYCTYNKNRDKESAYFWNINLDHLAEIDLPTIMEYIEGQTG